jgi:hypothetical protein
MFCFCFRTWDMNILKWTCVDGSSQTEGVTATLFSFRPIVPSAWADICCSPGKRATLPTDLATKDNYLVAAVF